MKRFSRVIAFAICLIMVVGMLPTGVFAAGGLADIDFANEADAAKYEIIGQTAIIRGVKALHGARVTAFDLRCGAALALAGLAAEGETEILYAERIDRGYDRMDEAIRALGGQIQRKEL